MLPSASMSMPMAAGIRPRPGMVRMSPQMGYTKPAPTEARTSRTGKVHPVGAPFNDGSDEIDRCVLAMHTGRFPNPASVKVASCLSAVLEYSTPSAPYTRVATVWILDFNDASSGYSTEKLLGSSAASATASANSVAPRPPSAKRVVSAERASYSAAISPMAAMSAAWSPGNT